MKFRYLSHMRKVKLKNTCAAICTVPSGVRGLKIGLNQGCGNTMPDLSDMVPFHQGQVENFFLLVLGQVQMY